MKKKQNKKPYTIDCTPGWVDIIMIHAVAATNGTHAAHEELMRCAQAADDWNKIFRKLGKEKINELMDS